MIRASSGSRWIVVLAAVLSASACADNSGDAPVASESTRPATSEQVREMSGLSHLPIPANPAAVRRSLDRHYPREFIGVRPRTAVLVDVVVGSDGAVQDVRVPQRPAHASANVRKVVLDRVPGSNGEVVRAHEAVYDQAFGPAAQAALREVRFHPALRDGKPVAYTMRMTVEFRSPA